MRKIIASILILLLAGCAGIPFCNENGQPKGCRAWDPATTTGAASR